MMELRRDKSRRSKVIMTWVERLEKGKARIHVVVEESFDVKDSYESVRKSMLGPKSAVRLVNAPSPPLEAESAG